MLPLRMVTVANEAHHIISHAGIHVPTSKCCTMAQSPPQIETIPGCPDMDSAMAGIIGEFVGFIRRPFPAVASLCARGTEGHALFDDLTQEQCG